MSLFDFFSKKPALAAPSVPPINFLNILIRKCCLFPEFVSAPGESKTIARQLDVTLMRSGFKLSPALLDRLGRSDFASVIASSNEILSATRELLGDHVKHNPYFIRFPQDVPDTLDFWIGCIFDHYVWGESVYGEHVHSFEEMVRHHVHLQPKAGAPLKVINLGGPIEAELRALFITLAGATIPLNSEDRKLLGDLFAAGHTADVTVRIRENKAILNALRLSKKQPIDVDTVVDVLRLACALSDGDVTLATATKFRSFPRSIRRKLVEALDALLAGDQRKIDDAAGHKERFKRLAEKLHPREYPKLKHAAVLFDFTGGAISVETFGRRVHEAFVTGQATQNYKSAVGILSDRPGYLLKHIDLILRSADRPSREELLTAFSIYAPRISGRNLLNLEQHLVNRMRPATSRVFVNRLGGGFAVSQSLPVFSENEILPFLAVIRSELLSRIPVYGILVVDWNSLEGVAAPISEKSKSDGFAVLPRGSVFPVMREVNGALRFFIYWKQRELRTDYDLSCAFYDANFELITQVSWTNLRDASGAEATIVHSGDFTTAPEGATEFIDIDTAGLDPRIVYILPSVNFYAGENFATIEEAFFGFMERPANGRGLPFEARTVSTKFALKGEGKVCIPMVFKVADNGIITGKWLDIYAKGLSWANRVENHKFTTIGLAKAILERAFTPLSELVKLYEHKAVRVIAASDALPKVPVTYIGLRPPAGLHPDSKVITLESFRTLIPA